VASAEDFRQFVVARAGGACEYCHLLEAPTGVTFHIEHVLPRTRSGEATADTLKATGANRVFARLLQTRAGLIG
jgi:hypothetical protein